MDLCGTHIAPIGGADAAVGGFNGDCPWGNDVAVQLDIRIRCLCCRVNRDGGIGGILIGMNCTAKLLPCEISLTEPYPAARVGDLHILHDETALCRAPDINDGCALCGQAARPADGIRLDVHIAARDRKIGQNESDGCPA